MKVCWHIWKWNLKSWDYEYLRIGSNRIFSTIVFIPDTYHTLSLLLPDSNKLSFIQYIPTGSIRPLWFLVQVILDLTFELNLDSVNTGHYLSSFLVSHPKDGKKHNDVVRWWTEWHETLSDPIKYQSLGSEFCFTPIGDPILANIGCERIQFLSRVKNAFSPDHSFSNFTTMLFILVVLLQVNIGSIY